MNKSALFVGWGALIPGREDTGGTVLNESLGYLELLKNQHLIDSFETVALAPHGGDLAGFVLVKGDKDSIVALQSSEEFKRISTRILRVHTGVRTVTAYTGAELGDYLALWNEPLDGQA